MANQEVQLHRYSYTGQSPEFHSVNTDNDNEECCITGICMPSLDTLVIVDQSNMKLKLLQCNNFFVISEFPIQDLPFIPIVERELYMMYDVCDIKRYDRFAVTVSKVQESENGYVYLMRVTQGEIQYDSHSECQHDTRGLAYYGKHMYVGSKTDLYRYFVESIDQRFTLQWPEIIYRSQEEDGIFVSRFAVSDDMIYITDRGNNRIVTIPIGIEIETPPILHMPYPAGVCITYTGTVLVCGLLNELLHKTRTRYAHRIFFTSISRPTSVFHDSKSKRIIIGGNSNRIAILTLADLRHVQELH